MKYLIVRDGKSEYLLGLAGDSSRFIATSSSRLDLYVALIADAGVAFIELDTAGFPVPVPVGASSAALVVCATRATAHQGKCQQCGKLRVRNGEMRNGGPRWACPSQPRGATLAGEKPVARVSGRQRKGGKRHGGRDHHKNPPCPKCSKPMNISGRNPKDKNHLYYVCKQGCPAQPRGQGWSSTNLPPAPGSRPKAPESEAEKTERLVRGMVVRANNHAPQDRDDIVQQILTDLAEERVKFSEIDHEYIRRTARSIGRLSQNKHRDVPLDAPVGDSGTPLADALEG